MNHIDEQENCQNPNVMNDMVSEPESSTHSYASNVEPVSSCSSTLISSELAFSSSPSPSPTPPPSQPLPHPPYPYPYGYPWYPPPTHMTNQNCENCPPVNWHYPYGMHSNSPTPSPVPTSATCETANPPTHYPPYPYYYPYYPPPPPHMAPAYPSAQNHSNHGTLPCEFDLQNMYPYPPPPPPYYAYPYPVAPSYSQSSNSRRASSVLPDIIITPSTDDAPSKGIMQHHAKLEKEPRKKRATSMEIQGVSKPKPNPTSERPVVDILTQHLENLSKCMANNLNTKQQIKKSYKKNIDQKSPEDNTSPVQINMVTTESERDSDNEASDSEITPKQMDKQGPIPLKSIRSVNNIQIYNGPKLQPGELDTSSDSETEDDEEEEGDDETTADGESDVFDEEEEEKEEDVKCHHLHHDYEEQQEDSETEEIVDDNLSVIYEEESELEKSSDMAKTVIRGDRSSRSEDLSLDKKIEENDEEDKEEDSNSVTVRLPLKFSFSTNTDDENIATVEVGKSQIEEKRNTISQTEKRNSFRVAIVKSDSEDEDEQADDCNVSVTISLTQSSKSKSLVAKVEKRNTGDLYPIKDMPLPEEALEKLESSQDDVSTSFSLNMRNKFANETLNGGFTTNNIALAKQTKLEAINKKTEEEVQKLSQSPEEMDFFATLLATKMQAQKIKEQSASYWGKSTEKETEKEVKENETNVKATLKEENKATNLDFWNKYSSKEPLKETRKGDTTTENKVSITQEIQAIEDIWAKKTIETKTSPKIEKETEIKATFIVQDKNKNILESKENKLDFWKKYSSKAKEQTKTEPVKKEDTQTENKVSISQEIQAIEDIWAKKTIETETSSEAQEELKKPKFSYRDRCSSLSKEEKELVKEPKEVLDTTFWDRYSSQKAEEINSEIKKTEEESSTTETFSKTQKEHANQTEEIEDIWAQRDEDEMPIRTAFSFTNNYSKSKEVEAPIDEKELEEVVDIWADRVEDLPPIKPIKSKLKSLESAKDSFWSSVKEANKQTEIKPVTTLPAPETITTVELNMKVLRSFVKELPQSQMASLHYEEPLAEPVEEIDFWAQIEEYRERQLHSANNKSSYISSFGEPQDYSMYNDDILPSTADTFDPLKYPEEPREVDTDEEIDFWAEIEAKRQTEEDDVTFHKSATFWASRERQNSVEETPYKPVLPKALHAKLPDEPATINIDVWQTLDSHKGEEPIIIDPQVEEEKVLALEYDKMQLHEEEEEEEQIHEALEYNFDDTVSVHEPIVTSVWCPFEQELEVAQELETNNLVSAESERDELEIKRNNYRKAMAFFTTSIDENKEQSVERHSKIKTKRSSYIEEEEDNTWDWDAVNEALQQEAEKSSAEETKVTEDKETFDKELTPQVQVSGEDSTALPEVYVEPSLRRLSNGLPDMEVGKFYEQRKISVKDRISAFETGIVEPPASDSRRDSIKNQSLSVESRTRQSSLSRNSSTQRSESEMDEDDSGVTDMSKQMSETDTESESFPELRKMSSYQRASTHSRLFKLLQDYTEVVEASQNADEFQFKPSRRKIVHNVSITRKQNPQALAEAETMSQRRERLSLPLCKNASIDADNPSTPNSPASPITGHAANKNTVVTEKLVSELVQSLLLKSDSTHFRHLPMEKLQAAAKLVLEEELDSLDNTSVDSTPAITPNEMKKDKSYADYYNTWSDAQGSEEIVPSKSFRNLQDTKRIPWTARCPRVLGSKTLNRDLSRVTESPEIYLRSSKSPECFRQSRECSIGKWRKT